MKLSACDLEVCQIMIQGFHLFHYDDAELGAVVQIQGDGSEISDQLRDLYRSLATRSCHRIAIHELPNRLPDYPEWTDVKLCFEVSDEPNTDCGNVVILSKSDDSIEIVCRMESASWEYAIVTLDHASKHGSNGSIFCVSEHQLDEASVEVQTGPAILEWDEIEEIKKKWDKQPGGGNEETRRRETPGFGLLWGIDGFV